MDNFDGFVPIVAMFYAVFHPTQGTKVVHQVPSGSVTRPEKPDSSTLSQPLFDFDSIKNYVIPKPNLCNRLITFKIMNYRVVGYPVNIYSSQYARNSFNFNLCFVFPYESDTTPYEGQVRRIGKMFRALEEQSQLLSTSEVDSHVFFIEDRDKIIENQKIKSSTNARESNYLKIINDIDTSNNQPILVPKQFTARGHPDNNDELKSIESLVQQIFQDLNNYSECLIPIDEANSIDIKLFPIIPPPVEISASDVPIATLKLDTMVDVLWDPTMVKLLPFINGINSIDRIAKISNSDYELTKQCIQHLLHYKAVTVLDIFQFSNSYAPTNQIGNFLKDPLMAYECQAYVACDNQFGDLPLRAPRASATEMDNSRGRNVNSNNEKEDDIYEEDNISNRKSVRRSSLANYKDRRKEQLYSSNQASSSAQSISPKANVILEKTSKVVTLPSKASLFFLYRSLHQNLSLKQWYMEHRRLLVNIDIRRFISFGVLRGLIYRVKSYPISTRLDSSTSLIDKYKQSNVGTFVIKATEKKKRSNTFVRGSGVLSSSIPEDESPAVDLNNLKEDRKRQAEEQQLLKLLKKFNDFDLICTKMDKSRADVESILNGLGEWSIINS